MFRIDTDVPYGNACDIAVRDEAGETVVEFAPDPHGGPECLWFCFRLVRAGRRRGGRLRLVLRNLQNVLGGRDAESLRPVMRPAGGDWQRLDPGVTKRLADGRMQGVWQLDTRTPSLDVALCYPYGMPEVEALVRETNGCYHLDTVGVSQGARPLVRLSNDYGTEGGARPGLYLIARQHSGETPGSWVLDGLLRRLAERADAAPLVWAVPLGNIDGVEQGDYGKDNFPCDLNRAWGTPPMRHETLVLQRDMRRWARGCRPLLGADFHAPGACESDGIYIPLPNPERAAEQHAAAARWAPAMNAALAPEYAAPRFAFAPDWRSRWNMPRFQDSFWQLTGAPGLVFETPYSLCAGTVMTRAAYRDAGRRIADAVIAGPTEP